MDKILENLTVYNNIYKNKIIIDTTRNEEPIEELRSFSSKDIELLEEKYSLEDCLKKINIDSIKKQNILYIENDNSIKLYKIKDIDNFYLLKCNNDTYKIKLLTIDNIKEIDLKLLQNLKINEIRHICSYLNISITHDKNKKTSYYNKNSLIKILTN